MGKKALLVLSSLIGLLVLVADFLTKQYVQNHLPLMYGSIYPYRGIAVFKDFFGIEFSLVHATNRGAAWGMFADFQFYLICLRIILIACLLIYLIFYNKHKGLTFPLVLITVGAFGNIVDYFLYGHVIDMFHFVFWGYSFPVFNVADSAICVGIFSLLIRECAAPNSK